jgi:hypothetical protein
MLDMKTFRKVSDDGNTAVLQHEKGHRINIVKSALSKPLRTQLDKLPLYQASPDSVVEDPTVGQRVDAAEGGKTLPMQDPNPMTPEPDPLPTPKPDLSQTPQAPPQQTAQVPTSPQFLPPNAEQDQQLAAIPGYTEQANAAAMKGKAEAQGASAQAKLQNAAAKQLQDQQAQYAAKVADLTQHIAATTKDIEQGHINPEAYMESKDALNRVTTGIGLALGAFGSAKTGAPNYAFQYLQSQIDRNIEAQKANLGNKKTLLEAYNQQFGDMNLAENMTRATNANILANQIAAAGNATNSQLAKANAQQMAGQLKQQYIPALIQQGALNQLKANAPGAQPGQPQAQMDTATKLQLMHRAGIIDKDTFDKANAELKTAEATKAAHDTADEVIDQTVPMQGLKNRVMSPIQSGQRIAVEQAKLYGPVMNSAPSKRLTPEASQKLVEPFLPGITSNSGTSETMRDGLHNVISTNADPTPVLDGLARMYGVQKPQYTPMVKVAHPDGRGGKIPKVQLQDALKQGFKLVQ